ncbi:SDR family NAD(P)-dependent oxidoreductase [Streptomyces sp. NBC_00539]|uniref:SDR family NAD(P)-dependent oxidoreductase n=1 Tax=Streptomyces sp. NBC_00539 TaxID=2975770 RepID=UPI002E81D6B6|nr:SDR family NAD(P)-dependent oxidoreductase [Streptomyces sp. NBC_00539]WUC63102.1 SDR family NAD(P)-dependent oxidoreductase [Streptomyces sp. NBC_00539]
MDISGSNVLLTGATGGIGSALAARLTAQGARLTVSGRRREALKTAADAWGAGTAVADLAVRSDVVRLAETCAGTDVLVANAALPASGDLADYTEEQLDRALDVNLRAPVLLSRLLSAHMVARGRGHIVLVGSMSGKAATKSTSLYNATKFGLRGFALALRQELRGTGVGVSLVQPGFVRDAGMFAATGAAPPKGLRTVTPGQVADGVVRAVHRDRCEVNVAPLELRLLSAIAGQFPGFAERVQARVDFDGSVRQIVEAQRSHR